MSKGKICLLLSAFVYGIVPVFAKFAYQGGTNSYTLTFLRAVLTLPVLFAVIRLSGRNFRVERDKIYKIIILGTLGAAAPIVCLYISYEYINVGLASTLHFIYPLITVIAGAFIYREKITLTTLGAVILVTLGVMLFADVEGGGEVVGVIFALLSGIFYSFFVIYIERSGLDEMDYLTLTFYMLVIMSIATFIFAWAMGGLDFNMSAGAWVNSIGISLMVTFIALPMFQLGVRFSGPSTAGIMSGLEPVVSIAAGAAFLGETVGAVQLVGALLIFAGLGLCKSV